LTLTAGAFIGGGSGIVANFAAGIGNYIRFVVVSTTQVLVTDSQGVTFP